jgi:DNA polymerase-3 subunit delta'
MAFEVAKVILCENRKGDNCTCRSCRTFNLNHPDFICIGWHDKIKVADVDFMLNFVSLTPFLSDRKVVVINNADDITWEASNRLLKVLEEPPEGFTFILVSSDPQNIISTVRYRCLSFEFKALTKGNLISIISQKLGYSVEDALILGNLAIDSSADIFTKAGQYLLYQKMALEYVMGLKHKSLIDLMDFIDKVDKTDMIIFSDMVLLALTDLLLLKNGITSISNQGSEKELKKCADRFNEKALAGIANLYSQVKKNSKYNINMNLVMKNVLIKTYPLIEVQNAR